MGAFCCLPHLTKEPMDSYRDSEQEKEGKDCLSRRQHHHRLHLGLHRREHGL